VSEFGLYYKSIPLVALTDALSLSTNNVDVAANIKRDEAQDVV